MRNLEPQFRYSNHFTEGMREHVAFGNVNLKRAEWSEFNDQNKVQMIQHRENPWKDFISTTLYKYRRSLTMGK